MKIKIQMISKWTLFFIKLKIQRTENKKKQSKTEGESKLRYRDTWEGMGFVWIGRRVLKYETNSEKIEIGG